MLVRLRSLSLLIACLAILLTPSEAFAAYYGTCSAYENNLHGYADHNTPSTNIDYVTAKISALRTVHSCTGSGGGSAMILPANLQGASFVQLGFGSVAAGDPAGWIWTSSDASGGVITHMTSCGLAVVYGDAYTFTIAYNSSNASWDYTIANNTVGGSCTVHGSAVTRYGTETWYGYEIHDSWDQYGGPGSAIHITNMGWQNVGSNTTQYVTGTPTLYHLYGTKYTCYKDGVIGGGSGPADIWAYTQSYGSGGPNSC